MHLQASLLVLAIGAPGAAAFQGSPFSTALPAISVTTPAPGAFLTGTDDCNAAHLDLGSGDLLDVPFATGTTGAAGQNELLCYEFGQTGIDQDVWFDWTADEDGLARLSTCAFSSTPDTRIAAWPLASGCPLDGTALACNDTSCGNQSRIVWPVTAGTSYTLQIGTFPGAQGGSGTFDLIVPQPVACGVYDDGTSENALGLIAGGDTGWLHFQDCLGTVDRIESAWGTPCCVPPGDTSGWIVAYEDADCDADPTTPASGMTVMWSLAIVHANAQTDILNSYPYPGDMGGVFTDVAPSGCTFVLASSNQASGDFPTPMDQTNPTPNAWVVGSTLGPDTLDVSNLNNNNVSPLQLDAIGFPAAWLLRAHGTETTHEAVCFGDTGCPCGNDGPSGGGCANSSGVGAVLGASGLASLSADALVLDVQLSAAQPGVFFQGNIALAPPLSFGDGLRCCGSGVIRIGTYSAPGGSTDTATGNLIGGLGPPVSQHPGNAALSAGDSRCYQWWYRDPTSGPCGASFNLSNAVLVSWTG